MQIIYKNLCLQAAIVSDIDLLNKLHQEATKEFTAVKNYKIPTPMQYLTFGDLPPGGFREDFELFSLYEGSYIIGYLTLYKGFPTIDDIIITDMYISKEYRGKGYGSIIIERLCEYCTKRDYLSIRVYIPYLYEGITKFWIDNKFDKIPKEKEDKYFINENIVREEYIREL